MEASKSGAGAAPIGLSALRACSSRTDNATTRCVRRSRSDAAALPKAAKLLEMEQARRPKNSLQGPYRASWKAFRTLGGSFAKVKKRVPWDWLAWFLSISQPQLLQNRVRGHPRIAAVPPRKFCSANWPTSSSSHLLSKRLCSPNRKASNRSLA